MNPIIHYVNGSYSIQYSDSGDWGIWRGGTLLGTARSFKGAKEKSTREHNTNVRSWKKRVINP